MSDWKEKLQSIHYKCSQLWLKKNCIKTVYNQIENINKDAEFIKKNLREILELKSVIIEMKNSLEEF